MQIKQAVLLEIGTVVFFPCTMVMVESVKYTIVILLQILLLTEITLRVIQEDWLGTHLVMSKIVIQ